MDAQNPTAPDETISDGSFFIWMDTKRMNAFLNLVAPQNGGLAVTREQIDAELLKQRFKNNLVNFSRIDEALALQEASNITIAQGTDPIHGTETQFIQLVQEEEEDKPEENAVIDFRARNEILMAEKDMPLLRRIPATKGIPGENLLGATIPAKDVKDIGFAQGLKGVHPDPMDSSVLRADFAGHPFFVDKGVCVDPVFTVVNVNVATGNITFDGCVKITGEVQSNMSVRASGDIFIDGTVEGAIIEAGGDIVAKAGIIGIAQGDKKKKDAFIPLIRSGGEVTAQFVQGIKIEAAKAIYIKDSAVQCELIAGDEIIVGKSNGKGSIIGGSCRADNLIKAKILGANNGAKTLISVGFSPFLEGLYQKACLDLRKFENSFNNLCQKVDKIKNEKNNPLLASLKKASDIALHGIELARQQHDELLAKLEALQEAQIIAAQKIYSGVELHLANAKVTIVNAREKNTFIVRNYLPTADRHLTI